MAKLSVDKALLKAKSHSKKGEVEKAQKLYQAILNAFPKNKRAQQGLVALNKSKQPAATQDPPQDTINQLIQLYNQGQLAVVVQQAQALTEQYPGAFFVWNILGAAAAQSGELDKAIIAFETVISLKPDSADAYYNVSNALKEQGKLEEAIEGYNKALAIKPDYAEAYNNMGVTLQEQDRLEEAIEAYNKALAIKPDFAEAFNNLGNALKGQTKLDGAIEAYNKALAIKPDYAEAYNNMGNALKDQTKLEEAIEGYDKALAIKPDYAEAYLNMGNALKDQGKLDGAIEAYNKAISLKPDYADAYYNVGNALKEQGKLEEAIEGYDKALAIKPDYAEAYLNMGNALKGIAFTKPNLGLQKIIISLLDKKLYIRPSQVAIAAISLLKFEPKLKRNLQAPFVAEVGLKPLEVITDLSELPLLLKLMSVCPLPDLDLENLFRELRASLLLTISDVKGSPGELKFQSALALQCFTNEYIYSQSEHEYEPLAALELAVKQALSNGDQPSSQAILCLASYKPLNHYEWSSSLLVTDEIEDVFTRQVIEPNQEVELKAVLPVLDDITDKVSSKVRGQYEVSPYPRWVDLGLSLKPATISNVIEEIKLKLFDDKIKDIQSPNILVAGCGTGQHSIGTAARFENSKALAVDLSLSSLSYAKRKTEELGVKNIDYMQADILDLGKLNKQFDILESSGVLHHLDDPVAGWRVLTGCLKPGGLMKIGLYSELARQHIVEIRREISKYSIGSSNEDMKSFRAMMINSDHNRFKKTLNASDFYSLSELKDLLFHVQEHRFTIPQIQGCLSELRLKFCGFEADKIVSHFKIANTDADDPYDLDKWQTYEEENPNAFVGMYQFWCQKAL